MSGLNKADVWAGNAKLDPQSGNIEVRQFDVARLIADRPALIVVTRRNPNTREEYQLAPQVMRLEIERSFAARDENRSKLGNTVSVQHVLIVGYKNHPTIPDTDLLRGDQFFFANLAWEVESTIVTIPDRLLASASLKGY